MQYNILIEYKARAGYLEAKREVERIMERLGDSKADVDLLVPGWILVKTNEVHKDVVEDVKDAFSTNPDFVKTSKRWIPVDYWCELEKIPDKVREEYGDILLEKDRYHLVVEAHGVDVDVGAIRDKIASAVKAKLEPDPVEKILRVDVFAKYVSLAMLGRHSVFLCA